MKGPLYRSDDYNDSPLHEPTGIEGTREEVEAYERAQLNPLAKMHFPYKLHHVIGHLPEVRRSNDSYAYEKEAAALVAFGNLAPLIGGYKEARINQRGEQHVQARPSHPVLWDIKKLFDGYDAACELARKI